jgi:hypothetical protein
MGFESEQFIHWLDDIDLYRGGGIAMLSGASRAFTWPRFALTVTVATAA